MQPKQAQTQHHKRKRAAVIHAGFTRQGKAQLVAVVRVAGLHVRGQHGVGGRQDCPQQDACAHRQVQQQAGVGRHQANTDNHRHRCQQHRRTPAGKGHRRGHFDPGRKQGDQHHHFGQRLKQLGLFERVEVKHIEHGRPHSQAHEQIHNGGRHGQVFEQRGAQTPCQQDATHQQKPLGVGHGCLG